MLIKKVVRAHYDKKKLEKFRDSRETDPVDSIDERHFTWVQAFTVKHGYDSVFQNGGQASSRGDRKNLR